MQRFIYSFFLLILSVFFIGCSASEAIIYMEAIDNQDTQLNIRIEGDLSLVMMNYLEDLDVLREVEVAEDVLPSSLSEIASWLAPFGMTIMQRRGVQRVYTEIQVASLAQLAITLKQQEHDSSSVLNYYQDPEKVHHLTLGITQEVLQELYEAMPSLPVPPSRWTKATRKEYIEQLANVFGATRSERTALAKELEDASLEVTIIAPKRYRISATTGAIVKNSANNELMIKLNIVDFLAGVATLDVSWYAIGS